MSEALLAGQLLAMGVLIFKGGSWCARIEARLARLEEKLPRGNSPR